MQINRSNQANLTPRDTDKFISHFQEYASSEVLGDTKNLTSSPSLASLPQLPDKDFLHLVGQITLAEFIASSRWTVS